MSNRDTNRKHNNGVKPITISAAVFGRAADCAYANNENLVRFFEDAVLDRVAAYTKEVPTKPDTSTEGLV